MRYKLTFILLLTLPYLAYSQLSAHKKEVPDSYNFWLYLPDNYYTQKESTPLLIFLHGNSLCGNDLNRVKRYGTIDAIERGLKVDAVVLAPQNPGGAWRPEKINKLLDWALQNYPVDTNRIYVFGMSLGGYGTLDYTGTYPERIAAAVALCGGANLKSYCGLGTFPLWIAHGTADRSVPVSQSQKVVNAIKACGPTDLLRFSKLQGVDHSYLARAFYVPEPYEWLFCHTKADSSAYLNTTIPLTKQTMANAYTQRAKTTIRVDSTMARYRSDVEAEKVPEIAQQSDSSNREQTEVKSTQEIPTQEVINDEISRKNEPENSEKYHIVKKGDTLYAIARRYGTTIGNLCKINNIKENSILQIGQKIQYK